MEPITVILIVVAVLLLIGSCFLPAKDSEATAVDYDEIVRRLSKRELTPEEQEMFLRKMNAYCMEVGGKSLKDWELEFQQNQSSTAMTEAPQM